MIMHWNKLLLVFCFMIALVFLPELLDAQCPMCRITAESNLANGGQEGQGLNNGIFLLLLTPYFIVGFVAYVWWKNRKKNADLDLEAVE